MRPYFNQKKFQCTYDKNFEAVIRACGAARSFTWITEDMVQAYIRLHQLGFAHSVEVWKDEELVGGLYGVSIGKVFFGESMFSKVSNASKFGFISFVRLLQKHQFTLIDCQQKTKHLRSLGARVIPRDDFIAHLEENQKHDIQGIVF